MNHQPTPEELQAVQAFRDKYSDRQRLKRLGCRTWIEALQLAWYQGWDDREPGGGYLRRVRNDPRLGHEWLALLK
jgi:hypothetical protein